MIDFETKLFFEARVADARKFLTDHKTSLIELGFILGVNAIVAGSMLAVAREAPVETGCATTETREISGALNMPTAEDRAWQWPIAETPTTEEVEPVEDEPVRRVRRHRRRG